jgi:hypothetical protein
MWAKYAYNANITQAQMLDDLVAILTGTTDKATLSAGCDQANTEILATYDPAGWTLHDAAAGANAKVIKAPCQGDAAQFKFVEINTNTAGQVFTGLWESFNETTHVGTNIAYQSKSTGYGQLYATTAVGDMYVSASSGRIILYGTSSAGNGPTNRSGQSTGVVEADRGFTWCAVGQGYVPVAYLHSNSQIYCSRSKGADGIPATSSNAGASVRTSFGLVLSTALSPISGPPSASGNHAPIGEFGCGGTSVASVWFNSFAPSGVKLVGIGNAFDEFSHDSKTWVILPASTNFGGYMHYCVPKG